MSTQLQVFRVRAITAFFFVLIMLSGLFWDKWSFIILFIFIHFGCWYEFVSLMKKTHGNKYLPYVLWGIAYITFPILMICDLANCFNNIHSGNLTENGFSIFYPILIIASLWINDTMAYIIGSLIGKTPLSKLSPKKTWEGTIGGVILSALVITVFAAFKHWPVINCLIITLITSITGTMGDLLESKIKRMADVKDSGIIMPGHGGFLDRFDSLLIAVPVVWLYLQLSATL